MASVVAVVFSLTGRQLLSKAFNVSAFFFSVFSAVSDLCHLVVTVPLRRVPSVTQAVVFAFLRETQ